MMLIPLIPLSFTKVTIVDDDDYDLLIEHLWKVHYDKREKSFRVFMAKKKSVQMSRFIMKAKEDEVVDHINHNTLDNRKCNLRKCTKQQNNFNRVVSRNNLSGYKGVYWSKVDNKWRSSIRFNGKSYHLGSFENKIKAAKSYNKKAKELFGEFAYLNKL